MMLSTKVIKYKILEYCLDVIFEKIRLNFVDIRKYLPLNFYPHPGYVFKELAVPSLGWYFRDCKVNKHFTDSDGKLIMEMFSPDAGKKEFGTPYFWIREGTDNWYYKP